MYSSRRCLGKIPNDRRVGTYSGIALALALVASCGQDGADVRGSADTGTDQLRRQALTLSVSPDPVQAGPIYLTSPVATATGLRRGKTYYLGITAGEDFGGAVASIGAHVVADQNGTIVWPFEQEGDYGRPDATLLAGTATLSLWEAERTWKLVAELDFEVSPGPASLTLQPEMGLPGVTRTFDGSGAPPNATLEAMWYETSACTCWMFGCYDCQWNLQTLTVPTNADGTFSGEFAPTMDGPGWATFPVAFTDQATGAIVANADFKYGY